MDQTEQRESIRYKLNFLKMQRPKTFKYCKNEKDILKTFQVLDLDLSLRINHKLLKIEFSHFIFHYHVRILIHK